MALKKKPVTGMKDMLPREMEIRDYLIGLIKETYKTYGFCSIETPCVEHIPTIPDSFRLHLRHSRLVMYGEQTVRRKDVSDSSCSVILIS